MTDEDQQQNTGKPATAQDALADTDNIWAPNPDLKPLISNEAIDAARARTLAAREAAKARKGYVADTPKKRAPKHREVAPPHQEASPENDGPPSDRYWLIAALSHRLEHLPPKEAEKFRESLKELSGDALEAKLAELEQAARLHIRAAADEREAAGKLRYGQRHKGYSMRPEAGDNVAGGDTAAHIKSRNATGNYPSLG